MVVPGDSLGQLYAANADVEREFHDSKKAAPRNGPFLIKPTASSEAWKVKPVGDYSGKALAALRDLSIVINSLTLELVNGIHVAIYVWTSTALPSKIV